MKKNGNFSTAFCLWIKTDTPLWRKIGQNDCEEARDSISPYFVIIWELKPLDGASSSKVEAACRSYVLGFICILIIVHLQKWSAQVYSLGMGKTVWALPLLFCWFVLRSLHALYAFVAELERWYHCSVWCQERKQNLRLDSTLWPWVRDVELMWQQRWIFILIIMIISQYWS